MCYTLLYWYNMIYEQADLLYDGGIKIAVESGLSSVAVALQLTVCVPMLKGRLALGTWTLISFLYMYP